MKGQVFELTSIGRILFISVALLSFVAGLALFVRSTDSRPHELRVGFHEFTPFTQADPDGNPQGMAVEIIRTAASRAHVKLRWIRTGPDVDDALQAGKVDMYPILTLTDSRQEHFHTSQPWWENESILASLETLRLQTGSASKGKRIAIRGLAVLKALAEITFPDSDLVTIPDARDMINALCRGEVDGAFLDVRLLQAQLMKGPPACAGHPLFVASVPNGSLSLGTVARKGAKGLADEIYNEIAGMAVDGSLSAAASRWSMVSSFQNRHLKEILETRQRATLMRFGLFGLTVVLIIGWTQTRRMREARIAAEESEKRFETFMTHTPTYAYISDNSGSVIYRNRPIPTPLTALTSQTTGRIGQCVESTETITDPSGDQRHYLCLRFPFANPEGEQLTGAMALDITDRRKAEDALRFSQFSIQRCPDSVLWLDESNQFFYANDAACTSLGYTVDEFRQLPPSAVGTALHAETVKAGRLAAGTQKVFESSWRRRDGSSFPVEVAVYHVEFDGRNFVCCIGRDITAHKRVEAELSHQAQHDSLTGLPNRRALERALSMAIDHATKTNSGFAVFYLDLDGFKFINDTLGHTFGDALLQQLATRMEAGIRKGDMLARMGGDEFALIAPGIVKSGDADSVTDRLMGGLTQSFAIQGHELTVTASAGVSLFPRDGMDGSSLLRHADAAMYEAKKDGKNRVRFFDPAMRAASRERLELENQLRRALERNELALHFQPEISLTTNRVVRYEALLRWNNATLGTVSPARFIPIAEETGLIVPIGNWVLEQACLHGRRLFDSGVSAGVAVNVSSIQLARPEFLESVSTTLLKTGLPPHLLDIELTETAVMRGVDEVTGKLAKLQSVGVTISLDDFGTGYSSLSHLLKLKADHLKIDQSFVQAVPFDVGASSLTKGLISLAHTLGMKVVVEGVETKQQLELIREMGCDIAQGYLLGRPAPALMVERLGLAETA